MKQQISQLMLQALDSLVAQGELPDNLQPQISIDRTRDKSHGDLASNIALTLAKKAGKNPRDIAALICAALPASPIVERTEIAGPGFINFFLSSSSSQAVLHQILAQGKRFGTSETGAGRKVQV
jgi:arginyl-tRNA synthetase